MRAVGLKPHEACCAHLCVVVLQTKWNNTEEKPAVIAIGLSSFVAIWAAAGLVDAVNKLPLIGGLLEGVGLVVTSWFVYRNLIFGPDRCPFSLAPPHPTCAAYAKRVGQRAEQALCFGCQVAQREAAAAVLHAAIAGTSADRWACLADLLRKQGVG